jgi:probable F420-dependent oxidoreductase
LTTAIPALSGTGVFSTALRWGDPTQAVEAAAELEELGYSALWIPDVGGDVFGAVERLLEATSTIVIATGILNLWMHSPEETAAGYARLVGSHGNRVLLGIGVSHQSIVDADHPGRYTRPLEAMRSFLDQLDTASPPLGPAARVLAALGPKMLDLARDRAAGVHPYNVTPEHTARARNAVGSAKLVAPEQAVTLVKDPDEARALGRRHVGASTAMPNYLNNWRRLGFNDDDFAEGGSNRLIDALVAWGDEDAIASRVAQHFDAGADHVGIQVVSEPGAFPLPAWRRLAAALLH